MTVDEIKQIPKDRTFIIDPKRTIQTEYASLWEAISLITLANLPLALRILSHRKYCGTAFSALRMQNMPVLTLETCIYKHQWTATNKCE